MKTGTFRLMLSIVLLALYLPCCKARAQAPASPRAAAERSGSLTVTVAGVSRQFSLESLARLPQSSVTVHNAHTNHDEMYTGVAVSELLAAVGLPFDKSTQSTLLRSYVRAQGTDFYFVIYSATEVEPELNAASVLVATKMDGHPLEKDGSFKLVSSGDKHPARWVRNLISLTLVTLN